MISAEALAGKIGPYKESMPIAEERFPEELIPVLPLIPLEYLRYSGVPLNPRVPLETSQEDTLCGAWAALSVPKAREAFLRVVLQSDGFESDRVSRAAELLLPYIGKSLIQLCLNPTFESEQTRPALYMGKIIEKLADLPDQLMSQHDKIQLCTYWVRGLNSQSYDNEANSVIAILRKMVVRWDKINSPESHEFAKAVIQKAPELFENSDLRHSYDYEAYLQCIAMALLYGADPTVIPDSDQFFDKLYATRRESGSYVEKAQILSLWNFSEKNTKVAKANTMLRDIFTLRDGRISEGTYSDRGREAVRILGMVNDFIPEPTTLAQMAKWVTRAYNTSEQNDAYEKAVPNLLPILSRTDELTYSAARHLLPELSEKIQLDILVIQAKPSWLLSENTDESMPEWVRIIRRSSGNSRVMCTVFDSKIMTDKQFIRTVIRFGHIEWITHAGLAPEGLDKIMLTAERRRFQQVKQLAQRDMKSPDGNLPDSVCQLLAFTTHDGTLRKQLKQEIAVFFSTQIVRTDLPDKIKDELDSLVGDLPVEVSVFKQALLERGNARLTMVRKRYMEDVIRRRATSEVFEAFDSGFFMDGVEARGMALYYIFWIPQTARQDEYIPRIQQMIQNWFTLMHISPDADKGAMVQVMGEWGTQALKMIVRDPFWGEQLSNRPALRGGMRKTQWFDLVQAVTPI